MASRELTAVECKTPASSGLNPREHTRRNSKNLGVVDI